jgi:hypothetical protein
MLELLAVAQEDGWAFVRVMDVTCLVRPPYKKSNVLGVDDAAVETALAKHGFVAPIDDRTFGDWAALVARLNQQVLQSRSAAGRPVPELGAGEELLEVAPREVLAGFLDRVECELLPEHRLDHAANLLTAMLKLPAVRKDANLCERISVLLGKLQESRAATETFRREVSRPFNFDAVFPTIARLLGRKRVMELAEEVESSGQVFAIR